MSSFVLEKIGKVALFFVPLTPLVVYTGFLFPYNSGRNFFFRAIVLIATACWIVLLVREPSRYSPKNSFISWVIAALIVIVCVSTFFSVNQELAFWSSLERMEGSISVIFLAAFFFSSRALFNSNSWKLFFKISVWVALVVSLIAVLQLVGIIEIHQGGVRIDATLGNALFFAAYMLLSAGISVFIASGSESKRDKIFYLSSSVIFLVLMLVSASRGAFVALPVAFSVSAISALFLYRRILNLPLDKGESQSIARGRGSLKCFGIWTISVLIVFTGAFFVAREIPALRDFPLVNRILSISVTGQDAEARFLAWKIALQGTSDSLIFGLGHEGFRYAFAKYYDPKLYGREQWFDRAHNNYLDWLVQTGIIGLLAYLALWFFVFKKIFGAESCLKIWEKITLAGMFSAYAVFNLFSFDTVTASIIFFAFLSYLDSHENTKQSPVAEPCAARRREQSNSPAGEYACEATGALRVFVYCLITIIFLFIFYFVEYKPMLVARLAERGLNDSSPQLDVRLGFFKKAIALNTFATPEAREYLAEFAAGASGSNLSKESKSKIVDLVYSELSRQIESAPDDMRFPLRIGVVLNTYRYYAEAVHFIEKALALSPNKQPTMYELGTSFLNLGQYDKAVEIFKRAADLLPENEDNESKMLYVISLIYAHRFPEADSYTKRIFEEYPIIDSRVADAYRRVGQIQMASKIYAELERRKKERAQYEMTSA